MFEEAIQFLLSPPARLKAVGKFLSGASAMIIVVALYLHRGVLAIGALQSMPKVNLPETTLASLYPGLPTWFIPEAPFGFISFAMVFAIGVYVTWFAKRIEAMYGTP